MKFNVKGTKYSRDITNMALLCDDKSEVRKFESDMKSFRDNQARDAEINTLKAELAELKAMLREAAFKDKG